MTDMQRPESPDRRSSRPYSGGGPGERGGFRRAYGGPGGPGPGAGPAVDYRALVEFVARAVADHPDQVEINAIERGPGTVAIKVKMADDDLGRLIGRGGRNIDALRAVVKVASLRERRRVFVDIANTEERARGRGRRPR